jgi:hypothetical protein
VFGTKERILPLLCVFMRFYWDDLVRIMFLWPIYPLFIIVASFLLHVKSYCFADVFIVISMATSSAS